MDSIDKQILFHLQSQARISMTELGKSVGLSQPAVTERVKRMEENGVIKEYRTIISPEKIGKQAPAYILSTPESVMPSGLLPYPSQCRRMLSHQRRTQLSVKSHVRLHSGS